MLRSRFLLGVGGPAAMLTFLVLPSVRASADRLVAAPAMPPVADLVRPYVPPYQPGHRTMTFDAGPAPLAADRFAAMPRIETRPAAPAPIVTGPTASESDKAMPKPRRMTREGCETPLSSLVGPEARRMVPGRCMV